MKIKLTLLLIVYYLFSFGQTENYQRSLDRFLANEDIKNASVGIYAVNLNSGHIILDKNSNISIVPASILKLFTTATALEIFGDKKQFKTDLAYTGDITTNGVLNGNIYILGYGDPCLDSDNFNSHYNTPKDMLLQWVDAIDRIGIKKINGGIFGVPVKFGKGIIPDKWMWEDIANYYGTVPSGLNYKDNEYRVHFRTGSYEGAKTEIIKIVPDDTGLRFENKVLSASRGGDRAYIYFNHGENNRIIRGTLPWKRSDFSIRGSLPNPELYIAQALTNQLQNAGIPVKDDPAVKEYSDNLNTGNIFFTTLSPPIQEIINITNQKSLNLYAEALALQLSDEQSKDFPDLITEFWQNKGMDIDGLYIVDGSGLSPANGVTPMQMVFLLDYMKNKSPYSNSFINSLAVSGESGTLARTFTHQNTKGKIKAKSGGMTRVRAYAGYMTLKNKNEIAFCIIVNNYNCSALKIRQLIEKLFEEIAGF